MLRNADRARTLTAVLAAAVPLLLGIATLAGWLFGQRRLADWRGSSIPMAANTAFSFLALGVAVILLTLLPRRRTIRIAAGAAAVAVGLLAIVRLGELLAGFDAGSDRWIFSPDERLLDEWRSASVLAPIGRVALPTAALFTLAAAALFTLTLRRRVRLLNSAGVLSGVVAVGGFLFVLGYLYGAPLLYGASVIPMALNTAAGFTALGLALLSLSDSALSPLRAFSGPSIRARLLRGFLPFTALTVCAVPLLTHWAGSLVGPTYVALCSAALVTTATVVASLLCARLARTTETGIAQLEDQLRQSQKMDALGRLAGGVAHDFNNLLTVITGFSELALEYSPADPLKGWLTEIRGAGVRAASLTRQLLLFSRKQEIRPDRVALNAIVTEMTKMLRRLLRENIVLDTRLSERSTTILVDAGQMEQVVLNLVVNARDAMPKGGTIRIETKHVTVTAGQANRTVDLKPGDYVRLTVADTGTGMTPEVLEHLFEPFFTTKGKGSGTGMGLATVHAIVRQNAGHIEVDSKAGEGTTFNLYFPEVAVAESAPVPAAAAPSAGGRETILVVEDEPEIQSFIRMALQGRGYTVLQAKDGTEAVKACEESGHIHLMLTDSVMPLMSGTELARRLVAARPALKVVLMSGYTEDAVSDCPSAQAFLQKPFSADVLYDTIRKVLDGQKIGAGTAARR